MLEHPLLATLRALKLHGMALAYADHMNAPRLVDELDFAARLALLLEREAAERDTRATRQRIARARLRQQACLEDIDASAARGIDRTLLARLATGDWLRQANHVFITGATGAGKTYLACALGQHACRLGYDTLYFRVPRLLDELTTARADGTYKRLLANLARKRLLILDDWGLAPLQELERHDLLEVIEDRHGEASTVIASQFPVREWHALVGDATLADAILDRLVHRAYRINLKGESQRALRAEKLQTDQPV